MSSGLERVVRPWRAVVTSLFVVVLPSPMASAGAGTVSVLFPPTDLLTTARAITLRGTCAATPPKATLGAESLELECESWSLTGELELAPGPNLIKVGKVERWVLVVDKLTAAEQTAAVTLPGGAEMKRTFRAAKLHPALEDGCEVCHEDGPPGKAAPAVPDACLNCHDDPRQDGEAAHEYQHPPAEDGECLSCHDPHVGRAHHILRGPEPELCGECHDDVRADEDGEAWESPHPPVAKGQCSKCHALHGGAQEHLLRSRTNALCKSCHASIHRPHQRLPKKKKRQQRSTRVEVAADFPVSGNYLVCTGCHRPHGSHQPQLFGAEQGQLCVRCHKF